MNRPVIILTLFILSCFTLSDILVAQEQKSSQSVDIGVDGKGVSFGNSLRFTGLRINFRDNALERMTGLNITLWKPKKNEDAIIKGGAIGIWAPDAGIIKGITVGGVGTRGQDVSGLMLNVVGFEQPGAAIYLEV